MIPKKIQEAEDQTDAAYRELLNERDELRRKLIRKATEAIDAQLSDQYDTRLAELYKAKAEATKARQDAEIAAAIEAAPWPVGTKLVGWGRKHTQYVSLMGGVKTIEPLVEGVLEIVTSETIHPANLHRYSRAKIGSLIVRILKKDGTPGLNYEELGRRKYKWLPVGEKPRGAKQDGE